MQTSQQKLKAALEQAGLPYSQDSAIKWGLLLARFAKVRRAGLEAMDEAVEQKGTCLNRTYVKVWRTFATI